MERCIFIRLRSRRRNQRRWNGERYYSRWQGRFLVEKNTQADLLSGFWHFPLIRDFSTVGESIDLFEGIAEENSTYEINQNIPLEVQFESLYKMKLQPTRILPKTVKHIFSHQRWDDWIAMCNGFRSARAACNAYAPMGHKRRNGTTATVKSTREDVWITRFSRTFIRRITANLIFVHRMVEICYTTSDLK